jgi:hypothetical protein
LQQISKSLHSKLPLTLLMPFKSSFIHGVGASITTSNELQQWKVCWRVCKKRRSTYLLPLKKKKNRPKWNLCGVNMFVMLWRLF